MRDKRKCVALFFIQQNAGSHAGAWSMHAAACIFVAAQL